MENKIQEYWYLYQTPIDLDWYNDVVAEQGDLSIFDLKNKLMTLEMDARGYSLEEALEEIEEDLDIRDAQILYIRPACDKYLYNDLTYPVSLETIDQIIKFIPKKYTKKLRNKIKESPSLVSQLI